MLFLVLVWCMTGLKAQDLLYEELADKIDIVVAQDGSGDYTTIVEAIDAAPSSPETATVIYVKNGVYEENRMNVSSRKFITLVGQDVDQTILTYNPTHASPGFGSATFKVAGKNFSAYNLTIENSYGVGNQAEALATSADAQQFAHCRFVGFQDTYYSGTSQRNYFKDCLFIGAVDYIFGNTTVIFDDCQIHNTRDNSWITAANTAERNRFGYVFNNCWVTAKYGVKDVYFGRPWGQFANVTFFNCYLSDCMAPAGWDNTWGQAEEGLKFYEYKSHGPGADITNRVGYSRQLSDQEAASYVMDTIYSSSNTPSFRTLWEPTVDEDSVYLAVKKYFAGFLDDAVTRTGLSSLSVNGTPVGFDPNADVIDIDLPSGTSEWPVLEAIPENEAMHVRIKYPKEIPGNGLLVVSSKYEAMHKAYTLQFKNDQQIVFELPTAIPAISLSQNITECVTALDETVAGNRIAVYPNPAHGTFTIRLVDASIKGQVRVTLHNMLGQSVLDCTIAADQLETAGQMDVSGLPTGPYIVNVWTAQSTFSTKLFVK